MHEARIDISEIPDRPAQSCLIRRSDREPQNVTNGPLPTPYVCRHGAFPFVQLVKKLLIDILAYLKEGDSYGAKQGQTPV